MNNILFSLYTASQTRQLDQLAIDQEGIPGFDLMQRAAAITFQCLLSQWPECRHITVLCGVGNNGGDGYLIAQMAQTQGLSVQVYQLGELEKQTGDAILARQTLQSAGVIIEPYNNQTLINTDVIVDAILGTGLQRNVGGLWLSAIQVINQSKAPVISVDIPSGLHADTGCQLGGCVLADLTVTFIGRKQGLFTADGRTCTGKVVFDDLEIPALLYHQVKTKISLLPERLSESRFHPIQKPRAANSHKGQYGHVLIVGGAPGMNGAVMMAASAALRSGCGLVSIATHPSHAPFINTQQPEVMSHGVQTVDELRTLVDLADIIVVGPGLGQSPWARELFHFIINIDKPLVVDADGLNLLAEGFNHHKISKKNNWVLTPHPGEAGRLLACATHVVQNDRFTAIQNLQKKYAGICILKGAGSLLSLGEEIRVCSNGNPGMATAGMGDILSGVLGGIIAQIACTSDVHTQENPPLLDRFDAVSFAVNLHASAGDAEAEANGEKGLLATDLLPHLRRLMNDIQTH